MLTKTRLACVAGSLSVLAVVFGMNTLTTAQERSRDRVARSSEPTAPTLRERLRGGVSSGSVTPGPRIEYQIPSQQTPLLVNPQERIAPMIMPQWMLGIRAVNTRTGVTVTDVLPFTAARRAGLEPQDTIITVNGFQVGYVDGELFDLGLELQRQADATGRVSLLVQNRRDGRLVNLDVRMQPRGGFVPLNRGFDPRRAPAQQNNVPDDAI